MNSLVYKSRMVFSKSCALSDHYARQHDSEEEPYKSKYKGRQVLQEARDELLQLRSQVVHYDTESMQQEMSQNKGESDAFETIFPRQVPKGTALTLVDDLVARLDRRLGVNFVQTEENTDGLQTLHQCANYLEPRLEELCEKLQQQLKGDAEGDDSGTIKEIGQRKYEEVFREYMCLAMTVSIAIDVIDANNFLAMLWSGWGEMERALVHLRRAKHEYLKVMQVVGSYCPQYKALYRHEAHMDTVLDDSALDKQTVLGKLYPGLVTIESSYTHTHFYFAQVYGNLGKDYVATQYVESTLYRQLRYQLGASGARTPEQQAGVTEEEVQKYFEHGQTKDDEQQQKADLESSEDGELHDFSAEFLSDLIGTGQVEPLDALDWAKNSMRLCTFYVNKQKFIFGAHCLKASEIMLGLEKQRRGIIDNDGNRINDASDQEPEDVRRVESELHAHWGKLYVAILKQAHDRDLGRTVGRDLVGTSEESLEDEAPGITENSTTRSENMEKAIKKVIDSSQTAPSGETTSVEKELLEHESEDEIDGTNAWKSVSLERRPFLSFIKRASINLLEQVSDMDSKDKDSGSEYVPILHITLSEDVIDFATARDVFKTANKHIQEALEFFVLDGFVTDHVGLLSDLSKLYKYIAFWEEDVKRKQIMHNRRIQILGPLVDILNPSIYTDIHKEVSLEMGQATQECLDLKVHRIEQTAKGGRGGKPKKSDIRAINRLADLALGFYNHFIRCYNDSRFAGKDESDSSKLPPVPPAPESTIAPSVTACVGEEKAIKYDTGNYAVGNLNEPLLGATGLDEGSVEAYLTAHFCIARVLTKRIDPASRENDLIQSLRRSEWLLEVAPSLIPAEHPDIFSQELALTREHTSLLREKINYLHYRGVEL